MQKQAPGRKTSLTCDRNTRITGNPALLSEFFRLIGAHRTAFQQERPYQRTATVVLPGVEGHHPVDDAARQVAVTVVEIGGILQRRGRGAREAWRQAGVRGQAFQRGGGGGGGMILIYIKFLMSIKQDYSFPSLISISA